MNIISLPLRRNIFKIILFIPTTSKNHFNFLNSHWSKTDENKQLCYKSILVSHSVGRNLNTHCSTYLFGVDSWSTQCKPTDNRRLKCGTACEWLPATKRGVDKKKGTLSFRNMTRTGVTIKNLWKNLLLKDNM